MEHSVLIAVMIQIVNFVKLESVSHVCLAITRKEEVVNHATWTVYNVPVQKFQIVCYVIQA